MLIYRTQNDIQQLDTVIIDIRYVGKSKWQNVLYDKSHLVAI